jgi:elongation factor G
MADKKGPAPAPTDPSGIRNVVVVGPSGSGKTTLVEHLLVAAGAITRAGKVDDGTTVCDHDPAAAHQHRSVGLSVATVQVDGVVINLIDTPGYADFLGEVRAGLRAADGALFVVSAVDGIDAATQQLWNECEATNLPRAIVVTKMDKERADFEETVAICHRVFTGGGGVLPLTLPIHGDGQGVVGFIDLLTTRIHEWSTGVPAENDSDPEHQQLIENARSELIEGIITESEDETLMDRFVGGEAIEVQTLIADLELAVARGHFHPVVSHAVSPVAIGTEYLLSLLVRGFPSPLEHEAPIVTSIGGDPLEPLIADPNGPLCAEVIKTTTDPYVGKLSFVRVFSGTLRPDMEVHVSGHFASSTGHLDHDLDERVGQLSSALGNSHQPVAQAIAGSIVAVSKLSRAETGDTLSSTHAPLIMEPWPMPEPMLPVALAAHSAADEDKLGVALARLLAEDPTLRLEQSAATGQAVVWCLGEAHADLVVDRLKSRYGVAVDAKEIRLSLRETFTTAASGTGRVVKQSGGHGQYAVCEITVEPLPPGSGFEFVDKVVGGAVPRAFIPSVERGVHQQLAKGIVAGYPLVDIRVTLTDGKSHPVDSSDMAFQNAGALALKDAAAKVAMALLEPILTITVVVPDDHVGGILSDLATRRGQVTGTESSTGGRTRITALVPEMEVTRYAIDIRSLSHGTGQYQRVASGYAPMPPSLAKKLLDA